MPNSTVTGAPPTYLWETREAVGFALVVLLAEFGRRGGLKIHSLWVSVRVRHGTLSSWRNWYTRRF
eukprot:967369-Prorocentrum_lima.AAC.2